MLNAPSPNGSLQVTLLPAEVVSSGALWQVDGGIPQPSGATVLGLTVGSHTVSFNTVSDWTTPTNESITVMANSTATATGLYTEEAIPALGDSNFSVPALPSGVFLQGTPPTGPGQPWTFTGRSGVANDLGSPCCSFSVSNPSYSGQYAYIQLCCGGLNGSISQTISFTNTGTYAISFLAAGRVPYFAGSGGDLNYTVEVTPNAGGPSVLSVTNTSASNQPFTPNSHLFTISAPGDYTISFASLSDYGPYDDNSVLITDVSLSQATNSPTLGLISVTTNGNNITLSVTASDSLPFYSQWQLNGNGIAGATNSFSAGTATISYTITNALPFNSGNYQVVVANAVASEESPVFALTVNLAPPTTTNDNFTSSLFFNPLGGIAASGSNSSSSLPPADGPAFIAGKPAAGFLWYNWTASFTGVISLTTRGSSFDTLLGVYTGSALTNLTSVAEDDDSGGFFTSLVTFNCVQGTTYQIAVAGYRGAAGSVVLQLSPGPADGFPGPENGYSIGPPVPVITQQPASQIVHSNQTVTLSVTASDATSYQWYFTNAPVTGGTASTLVIGNFQAGAVGNYYAQASNSIGAVQSSTATIEIAAENLNGRAATPTNLLVDKFGDAVDLVGISQEPYQPEDGGGDTGIYTLSQSFSTAGATKEAGEPNHAGQPGGASYWYSYTAPGAGTLQFNTAGSTFNTILAVYIGPGNSFSTLTNVGAAYTTNYVQAGQPIVVISNVVADTKYFIAIDGYLGASGAAYLNVILNSANVIVSTNAIAMTNNTPVVVFTYPPNNHLTTSPTINVSGTVKGNGGQPLANTLVQVAINTNAFAPATVQIARNTIDWFTNVTLVPGANIITAQSLTVEGTNTNAVIASLPVTRTIFYDVTAPSSTIRGPLTLLTIGQGKITGIANPASLEIGKIYTVTAVPIGNWVFAGWMSGTNTNSPSALTGGATLAFDMSYNLILQANFLTNPFAAVAGVYNGLFSPSNGVSEESSGFITATIPASSKGAYSAKLLLDGGSYPFSGTFDLSGTAEQIVPRSGKTSITVDLQLANEDQIIGSVSDITTNAWTSIIQADRAVFNAKTNPATLYEGRYTLIIPPGCNAPTNEPGGYGYVTLSNNPAGQVSLCGSLADNTVISQSVALSHDGNIPLYVSLCSGKASLQGWLTLTNNTTNQPAQTILGANLSWIKRCSQPGTMYAGGFTNTNITVCGSCYASSNTLVLTNGTLTICSSNLADMLIYSNLTLTGDKLVNTNPDPIHRMRGVITPATGLLTVTFRPTGASSEIVAKGVVLQDNTATNAAGWFLDSGQCGWFLLQQ